MLPQNFERPANVKIMINIGATLDLPTGFYVKTKDGDHCLVGGLGAITAVVGRGNRYKSTIMHYMMLSAMDRIRSTNETVASTYDTEINIHEHALNRFINRFTSLRDLDILNTGVWNITDKTIYYANTWYEKLKEWLAEKEKSAAKLKRPTPFLDRHGKQLELVVPSFTEVDSFSEFETQDVADIQDNNELGDSGGNTIHMRQGLAKLRFLMEVPTLFGQNNHFLLMTAHLGAEINMATGPHQAPPPKMLQHMKQGEKIKGVTGKFFFLMNNCFHATNSSLLINQGTKGAEYPETSDDSSTGDIDLNLVTLQQLRGKSGPTGYTLEIIVSQSEGVLPELTEFHHIKSNDRFGISGTLQHYNLDIYPDVKLSRTTIRGKIKADSKLRRALNITSELLQIGTFHRQLRPELLTPAELYEGIKKQGYDWDMILTCTRSWWTLDDDNHPLRRLSTYDLVRMARGQYHPFWLEEDKKTIKPKYKTVPEVSDVS